MRLAWLTDIHLDFLETDAQGAFAREVAATGADGVVISGDITVARMLGPHLGRLAEGVGLPIWFVLGNHDYYGASIAAVRGALSKLTEAADVPLWWLPEAGVVPLGRRSALIGVDGWGDARLGRPETSRVLLSDFLLIEDLRDLGKRDRIARLRALGDAEAARCATLLDEALAAMEHVLVVTHVPPFAEACWYEGRRSSDDWLPWFSCQAVGEVLRERAAAHPERRITVVCGHTHGVGTAEILPNLVVHTGGAEYGQPEVQRVLELD